jgi:hypothetical protein
MDRTVREHIFDLEQRLENLGRQIMQNRRTKEERNRIESEIHAAEMALSYYRKALELEQTLS